MDTIVSIFDREMAIKCRKMERLGQVEIIHTRDFPEYAPKFDEDDRLAYFAVKFGSERAARRMLTWLYRNKGVDKGDEFSDAMNLNLTESEALERTLSVTSELDAEIDLELDPEIEEWLHDEEDPDE